MISAKLTQKDHANISKKWEELAHIVNNSGAKKNVAQWKKAFSELKTNTRRRAREVFNAKNGTGGGPPKVKELTDVEERLMGLLAKVTVEGANIPEPGLLSNSDGNTSVLVFDMEEGLESNVTTAVNTNGNNNTPVTNKKKRHEDISKPSSTNKRKSRKI
ncbi:hypothetical protein CBL_10553 [Carabus blaptoides fortunei]